MLASFTNETSSAQDAFHRAFETGLVHERKRLGQNHPIYINGQTRRSKARRFETFCPADRRVLLGRFQHATKEHTNQAVAAAQKAFSFWRELGWEHRLAFVRKMGACLHKHAHEFAALICLESGKNRFEASNEVEDARSLIEYYCRQMELHHGYRQTLSTNGSVRTYDILEPYGVWAVICPFGNPLSAAVNMTAATLVAGNTVVLKPSSKTPFTGLRLHDLFTQAGFPVGVVNCLTGHGSDIGPSLIDHPDLGGLAFAGSRASGQDLHQRFARHYHKPCILNLGGKNPVIVMPTANLEDAATGILRSAFSMCGQSHAACSRVYVHRDIAGDFLELLLEMTRELSIGHPASRETFMGPLIDQKALDTYTQTVRLAKRDGRILCGGKTLSSDDYAFGNYVQPTIVDRIRKTSPILQQELLLPLLAITEIKSLTEGIQHCNDSHYGLAAGLFTQVDGEQEDFFDAIQAGVAICNRRLGATAGRRPGEESYGGWKASGNTGCLPSGPYYLPQFMREQCRTVCW